MDISRRIVSRQISKVVKNILKNIKAQKKQEVWEFYAANKTEKSKSYISLCTRCITPKHVTIRRAYLQVLAPALHSFF